MRLHDGPGDGEDTSLLERDDWVLDRAGYGAIDESTAADAPSRAGRTWREKYGVVVIALCLLLFATANAVYFKKMTSRVPNYPFALMQISTVVYMPLCFVVVRTLVFTSRLQKADMDAPKSKFAVIALLDGLSGLFMLFGGVYTAGTTQMLLMQASIPLTMVLSVLILRSKVEFMQFIGAVVILSGVFVVMAPKLFSNTNGTYAAEPSGDILLFNVIFFLANIPAALGNVYKEAAFQQHENLNVWFVMMWTATFQTFLQWLMLPFNSLPFLGEQAIPMSQLPSALSNGLRCFAGFDTIVHHCYYHDPIPGMQPCDNCAGSMGIIVMYLISNVGFNILSILLIKEGSAALYIIVMTLRLPLGNLAFYIPWVMGSETQKFNSHDISGLVVILLGLVVYRMERSPDGPEPDAPFVVTSIVTFAPGVGEPVVNQIHRQVVQLRKTTYDLRSQLYARLGMPPSPAYREPSSEIPPKEPHRSLPVPMEDELSDAPVGPEPSRPRLPTKSPLHSNLVARKSGQLTPLVGVSPIARSAPLYSALSLRRASSPSVPPEELPTEDDDSEENDV